MKDPGTIYSDDEIECFSEDDGEDEKEIARQMISVKDDDPFFEDLTSKNGKGKQASKQFSSIDKYLISNNTYEVNDTIERVRAEKRQYESDEDEDDPTLAPLEKESYAIKEAETVLKLKDNMKKKEKKKERIEKSVADKMKKEREEFCFEDANTDNLDISFLEMNLSPSILKSIANMGYESPTPIQAATIPIALKGRDICGCAATGTGKTAAFMLPIVQRLTFKPVQESVTRVLVLVPTRELGIQVFEVARDICKFSDISISLSVGGLDRSTQTRELLDLPDIIIATPGRLIDHLHNTQNFSLKSIEVLVLDEADRMLDKFFVEQLNEVVRQCSYTRQTMLFSATMTDEVKDLVVVSLKNPVRVFVNNNTDVAKNLRQEFIRLKGKSEENRLAVLAHLLLNTFNKETIVFIQQKHECHRMHVIFGLLGLNCGELHGNLKQPKRLEYLRKFKDKEINILFATDVAARGLDIKGIKTVINYTVPFSYDMYVHRVGRTARAGFTGRSITIACDSGEDFNKLKKIQKHSLTPLFERIISPKHIMFYMAKLKKLEKSVKRVLNLEKEEKMLGGSIKAVDDLKSKVLGNKTRNRFGRIKKEEPVSIEEIKKARELVEERLKKIKSGEFEEKKKKEKEKDNVKPPQTSSKQEETKKRKKKRSKKEKANTEKDVVAKSIFDEDKSSQFNKRKGKFH